MANHWLKSGWIGDDTEKCDWLQMEKSFFLEALKTLNWKNQPHSSPEFVLNYLTPEPDGGAGGASGPALSLYCEHLLPTSCILSLPPLHPLLRTVFALKPGFLTWGPDSFLVFSLFLCFFACFCVFVCFFFQFHFLYLQYYSLTESCSTLDNPSKISLKKQDHLCLQTPAVQVTPP